MTCEQVIQALRSGKKVSHAHTNNYLVLEDNMVVSRRKQDDEKLGSCYPSFSAGDIVLGTDYEIYEPVLNEEERKYIAAIIAPLKKSWERITITKIYGVGVCKERILFELKNGDDEENYSLPSFDKGTMYNGMSLGTEYSLEELGL